MFIKYSLQLSKNQGYKSCPFDLCITPYQALYECLNTDFKYFFDELHLIPGENGDGDRSQCGKGLQNITNKYGIIFNHESSTHSHLFRDGTNDDDFYIRDDFIEFKKRYKQRISNFYNHIEKNDKIVLVHTYGICEITDLDPICHILSDRYPAKQFIYL
jgi:hypothetical protein